MEILRVEVAKPIGMRDDDESVNVWQGDGQLGTRVVHLNRKNVNLTLYTITRKFHIIIFFSFISHIEDK